MILMPLASHAANQAGWQAMMQAPPGGDRAEGSVANPSFYAGTWSQGTRFVARDAAARNAATSMDERNGEVDTPVRWHGLPGDVRPLPIAMPSARGAEVTPLAEARVTDERPRDISSRLPSYLATSTALMAYGGQAVDGLHERLGEIRNVMPTHDVGGDVFIRYAGGQLNYVARDASRHFVQRADNLQLGGAIAFWNDEGSSSRFGLAADKGTVRIRPKHATVSATHRATGFSAWYTRQQDTGGYFDAVLSSTRFGGRLDDGSVLSGDLKADQWTASVEVGQPMKASENIVVEPQAQLKHQSLKIASITDPDGSIVQGWRSRQTTARIGVRIAKVDNERFVPYMRLDVSRVLGGGSAKATVRHPAGNAVRTFHAERPGTSYGISAGMTVKVNRVVDFYADAKVQGRISGQGHDGLSASAGVRVSF